jgi:hypothetical protein
VGWDSLVDIVGYKKLKSYEFFPNFRKPKQNKRISLSPLFLLYQRIIARMGKKLNFVTFVGPYSDLQDTEQGNRWSV